MKYIGKFLSDENLKCQSYLLQAEKKSSLNFGDQLTTGFKLMLPNKNII